MRIIADSAGGHKLEITEQEYLEMKEMLAGGRWLRGKLEG